AGVQIIVPEPDLGTGRMRTAPGLAPPAIGAAPGRVGASAASRRRGDHVPQERWIGGASGGNLEERRVSFDPSAIHDYHDKVREKIETSEPGFAQSVVHEVMVSYEAASFRGPVWGYDPVALGTPPRVSAILEQIIIDVARGEGIASPRTFSRARVERLVADLQSFPRPT